MHSMDLGSVYDYSAKNVLEQVLEAVHGFALAFLLDAGSAPRSVLREIH